MASLGFWSPEGGYPATATAVASIATGHRPALTSAIANAVESIATAQSPAEIASLSSVLRGARASLSIISAEQVLATATASSVRASESKKIMESTYNLQQLLPTRDFYGYDMNSGGNGFFLVLFGLLFVFFSAMSVRSRYQWFNVCFVLGFGVEFVGSLARFLAIHNRASVGFFVLQNLRWTAAPLFIMAGIYFVFAQIVTVYGSKYSLVGPMWYPCFFISTDILALVIQAIGGGLAPMAGPSENTSLIGKSLMFVGILIEVVAITGFLFLCFHYPYRTFFQDKTGTGSKYEHAGFLNYVKMLLNVPSTRTHKRDLERFYNPRYQGIRLRPLLPYYPLVVGIAIGLSYIRCIYMVVNTKEGYSGYISQHEVYLFVFDSSLVALMGLLFVPFHPVFVFGRENVLRVSDLEPAVPKEESVGFVQRRPMEEYVSSVWPRQKKGNRQALYMV